jgi:carotenoid 1,2-hydratase
MSRGRSDHRGFEFDAAVAGQGYRWWYIDALSEDRRFGLTIIAFIGSVFSPYYFWSGRDDPYNHVALNVALYGAGGNRWAMTERRRGDLSRSPDMLEIGRSALHWDGDALVINFDEVSAPIPRSIRGSIRISAAAFFEQAHRLDMAGRHFWRPIMPRAPVEVMIDSPAQRWRGEAYVDSNFGFEPLEDGFIDWRWSRAHLRKDTVILYEGRRRDGTSFANAFRYCADGQIHDAELLPELTLPKTGWRIPRVTRADAGRKVTIRKTWEDTPFYARTALSTAMFGEAADAVHESLSLTRLRSPIVRLMLPFRMPRVLW